MLSMAITNAESLREQGSQQPQIRWFSSDIACSINLLTKRLTVKQHSSPEQLSYLKATGYVTCHMRSHSVTCHPTQVNVPRQTPAMQAGT